MGACTGSERTKGPARFASAAMKPEDYVWKETGESPVSLNCPWALKLLPYSTDALKAPLESEGLCRASVKLVKSYLAIGNANFYSDCFHSGFGC